MNRNNYTFTKSFTYDCRSRASGGANPKHARVDIPAKCFILLGEMFFVDLH